MKELFLFMAKHCIQLSDEIAQAYINTMRWYYLSHFQRYLRALEKLQIHVMEKYDTLGQEDFTKRSGSKILPIGFYSLTKKDRYPITIS